MDKIAIESFRKLNLRTMWHLDTIADVQKCLLNEINFIVESIDMNKSIIEASDDSVIFSIKEEAHIKETFQRSNDKLNKKLIVLNGILKDMERIYEVRNDLEYLNDKIIERIYNVLNDQKDD